MARSASIAFVRKHSVRLTWILSLVLLLMAGASVWAAFHAQSLLKPSVLLQDRSAQIYLAAAAVFAFAVRLPPAVRFAEARKLQNLWVRALLVVAGISIFAFAWWQTARFPKDALPLLLWPLSLAVFLAGAASWPLALPRSFAPGRWLRSLPWLGVVVVLAVFAFALGIRLYRLEDIPSLLIDEPIGGFYMLQTLYNKDFSLFVPAWEGLSNVPFAISGFTYSRFGESIAALRLPYAVMGALEVVCAYLLGKEIGGRKVGLVAAAALAVMAIHVHFSRVSLVVAGASLGWTGAAAFLARGIRRGSWFDWALAGAIAGFGINYYFGARLLPVAMLAFVAGTFVLRPRPWRWLVPGLAFLVAGFVIGSGPFMAYLWSNPDQMFNRTGESWLPTAWTSLTNPASLPKPFDLGQQFWDRLRGQALGFNLYGDAHTFYRSNRPILGALISPIFFLGVAALTIRPWNWRCLLLAIWLWSSFLLLGVGSNRVPVFHRPVPLFAVSAVAIGLALGSLGAMWQSMFRLRLAQFPYWLAVAAFIGYFGLLQLEDYFPKYTPRENWPTADLLVRYLHGLGPEDDVVMVSVHDFSAPMRPVQFGTQLGRKNPVMDWKDINTPVKPSKPGRSLVFVLAASRLNELPAIKAAYPGGVEEELTALGKPVWVVYRYSPAFR